MSRSTETQVTNVTTTSTAVGVSSSTSTTTATGTGTSSTTTSVVAASTTTNRHNNNDYLFGFDRRNTYGIGYQHSDGNEYEDEDEDDDQQQQQLDDNEWSAELIKGAAQKLHLTNPGALKEYERRLALREIKDLIRRATERSSGLLLKPDIEEMVKRSEDIDTVGQFTRLREELGNILKMIEAREVRAADMSVQITKIWERHHQYTPIDLLDVMILSGGNGIASSDMTFDALTILYRHWQKVPIPSSSSSSNSTTNTTSFFMTENTTSSSDTETPQQLGDILFGGGSNSASATSSNENNNTQKKPASTNSNNNNNNSNPELAMNLIELTADYMSVLDSAQVPRSTQNILFNQIKHLSPEIRQLRLMCGIARYNVCIPARDRFVETLKDTAKTVSSNSSFPGAIMPGMDEMFPPEVHELAEEMLPRIKAIEIACGFPFHIDDETMKTLKLNRAATEKEPNPSVSAALQKVLAF